MKFHYTILTISTFFLQCNLQNADNVAINNNSVNKNQVVKHEKILSQTNAKYLKIKDIPAPFGYEKIEVQANSYADFLVNLDLKTTDNKVYLHNGTLKYNQSAQFAVLKIDVGKRDLQQCADAVMRLRGEYLYSQKRYKDLHFNFLNDGKPRFFNFYAKGDKSYKKFRNYMNYIFAYANTASLKNELHKVKDINDMKIGDVFIQKGKPFGHAITVMNIAINKKSEKMFMLSQSYMPAQDIHILVNPNDKKISPWYKINDKMELITPEWTFYYKDLMRF